MTENFNGHKSAQESEQVLKISQVVRDVVPEQLQGKQFRFTKLHPKGHVVGRKKGGEEEISSGKVPASKWTTQPLGIESRSLKEQIETIGSYGVVTGYGRLVVIDVDHESGWQIVSSLPETFTVLSGTKRLPHAYFILDVDSPRSFKMRVPLTDVEVEEWANRVLKDGTGVLNEMKLKTLLDFQGSGAFVVGPGSRLDETTIYQVHNDAPIVKVTFPQILKVIESVGIKYPQQKGLVIEKAKELSHEFAVNYEKTQQALDTELEKPWKSQLWKEVEAQVNVSEVYEFFGGTLIPSSDVRNQCLLGHDSISKRDVRCDDDRFWHCYNCGESGGPFKLFHLRSGTHDEDGRSKWLENSEAFAELAGGEFPQRWKEYLDAHRAQYKMREDDKRGPWYKALVEGESELYKLNEAFFVAFHDGRVRVMEEARDLRGNSILNAWSDKDFKLRYDNQRIRIREGFKKNGGAKIKEAPLGSYWLRWNCRRTYDAVVFRPEGIPEEWATSIYNLWKGFVVKAKEGEYSRIESHLRTVWCRGNEAHYQYLIGWFAHLIQKPQEKPGVAIVIKGGKGAGKSTIFEKVFERILGQAYSKIDKGEQVTGKFNTHQRGKLLLVLEEAIWAGDKQAEGALKSEAPYDMLNREKYFRSGIRRTLRHLFIDKICG